MAKALSYPDLTVFRALLKRENKMIHSLAQAKKVKERLKEIDEELMNLMGDATFATCGNWRLEIIERPTANGGVERVLLVNGEESPWREPNPIE